MINPVSYTHLEQALDEHPMPDEQVSTPDMQEYGYSYDGMLPVTCLLYTSRCV